MSKLYICGQDEMSVFLVRTLLDVSKFGIVKSVPIRHRNDIPNVINSIPLSDEVGLFEGDKIVCVLDAATDDPEMLWSMKSTMDFLIHTDKAHLFYFVPFLEQQFGFPDRRFNDRLNTAGFRDFVRCYQNQLRENPIIKNIQKFIDE